MHGLKIIAALASPALLCFGALTMPAAAASPLPDAERRREALDNAALWYWQASALLPDKDALSDDVKQFLQMLADEPLAEMPESLREPAPGPGYDEPFEIAARGAAQPYCHFAVEWEQGMNAFMPHLSPMRDLAAWLTLSAREHLAAGESDVAAVRLATLYRLGDHLGTDGSIIGARVGKRMFDMADAIVAKGLEEDAFSAEDKRVLLSSLEWISEANPLGFATCMRAERRTAQWAIEEYQGDKGKKRFFELVEMTVRVNGDGSMHEESYGRTEKLRIARELDEGLKLYDEIMQRVVAAFENPDLDEGAAAIAAIEEELRSASPENYKWFAARFFASRYSTVHEWYREALADLEFRKASLAK